ncbi:MAG: hypothetical protein MUC63_06580 [Planctomycetes bacterium]|nr:hypothetical protein [Planctomycetota bacterium]
MDERVLRDEIAIEVPSAPSPSAPRLDLQVTWSFQQEYRVRKYYRVYREYLPYDPWMEALEVLSSPFLMLTALPASVVIAPVELIFALFGGDFGAAPEASEESGETERKAETTEPGEPSTLDRFLFLRMAALPFQFLNPAANADGWGNALNVYGKKAEFERQESLKEWVENPPPEEWTRAAEGAQITVKVVETGERVPLKADAKGRVLFPITVQRAQISQGGRALTLQIEASFKDKKAAKEIKIAADSLEAIYEALQSE